MSRLRTALGLAPASQPPEPPIRAELFSLERLEEHAKSLAKAQRVDPDAEDGPAARPAALRQHQDPDRDLSRDRPGEPRAPTDHAGGGMAARQFPCRRRADPRDQERSATGLLPAAAETGGRSAAGLSARVRRRLGRRRPHRQRLRHSEADPLSWRPISACSR